MSTPRSSLAIFTVLVVAVATGCITTVSATPTPTRAVTPTASPPPTPAPAASPALAPTASPAEPTASPAVPTGTAPPTQQVDSPAPAPTQDPWTLTATGLRDSIGEQFTYHCTPDGTTYTIWGTDTYTDDSSICTAAVHAGLVTLAAGGEVTIQVAPGQDGYEGTERNGVASLDYGTWGGSYVFVTD